MWHLIWTRWRRVTTATTEKNNHKSDNIILVEITKKEGHRHCSFEKQQRKNREKYCRELIPLSSLSWTKKRKMHLIARASFGSDAGDLIDIHLSDGLMVHGQLLLIEITIQMRTEKRKERWCHSLPNTYYVSSCAMNFRTSKRSRRGFSVRRWRTPSKHNALHWPSRSPGKESERAYWMLACEVFDRTKRSSLHFLDPSENEPIRLLCWQLSRSNRNK